MLKPTRGEVFVLTRANPLTRAVTQPNPANPTALG
jgi:hypothetical protein